MDDANLNGSATVLSAAQTEVKRNALLWLAALIALAILAYYFLTTP